MSTEVKKAATDELRADVDFLTSFELDLSAWEAEEWGAESARRKLANGEATNPSSIEKARTLKASLMSRSGRVKERIEFHGEYHPLIHVRSDGSEVHHDPFEQLFNLKLSYEIRMFVQGVVETLEAKLPNPLFALQASFQSDVAKLQTDVAKVMRESPLKDGEKLLDKAHSKTREALEILKKATPEQMEPLAAKARREIAELKERLTKLESHPAPKSEPWSRAHKLAVAGLFVGAITVTILLLRLVLADGLADTKVQLNGKMKDLQDKLNIIEVAQKKSTSPALPGSASLPNPNP